MAFRSTYTTGLGYTPDFTISDGDQDITSNFRDRTISLTIESYSNNGDGDTVTLVLDDRDFAIASPTTTKVLKISMGYKEEGVLFEQGTFTVQETVYSGMPRTMTITGHSLGFANAAKAPVITHYENQTLGDILGEIAKSAGVTLSADPTLSAKKIPYLHQHQSSLHLLQELERRYNGLAKFSDGILSFTQRGTGLSLSGLDINNNLTLTLEDMLSWSIRESNRTAFSKVRVPYFDKDKVQIDWVDSTIPGPDDATVPYTHKRAFNSKDEAQSFADSRQAAANRGTHNGTVTMIKGDPALKAGGKLTLSGIRDGVDGTYFVQKVTHSLTRDQGILTAFQIYDAGADGTTENDNTVTST